MTVFRVTKVDVDFDLRGTIPIPWVIDKVNTKSFEDVREREQNMVAKLSKLRLVKERRDLAAEYNNGLGEEFASLVNMTNKPTE